MFLLQDNDSVGCNGFCDYVLGVADKSLTQPGRKQATVTKFGIYSTYSTQRSIHSLALAVTFASHSKKIQKIVHPTRAAVTSMLDEK
jgi:hypothetical protein